MVKWDELKEGEIGPEMEYGPLMRKEFVIYADAGGDTNPIHTDEFAGLVNKGVIAHGLYSHAMLGKMLVDWVGHKNVRSYGGRMIGMARPGDMLLLKGKIIKKYEENGERLVDLEIVSTTKTTYLLGNAKADASISDEEIIKRLENAKYELQVEFEPAKSKWEFEIKIKDLEGIEINKRRTITAEPVARDWFRAGKDKMSAEIVRRKGDKFRFKLVRFRDSIAGTATVAIPE
ncbi:MAG: MaoC/PaaZ C-terminal domain-containing protein [Candidatus Helarchaeota archaeon]